ncbi:hypothetical protein HYZ82_02600 [Candidatus Nomurabacteria bacterium]|nr:hypothetical protein [Candidatus Nomurabacteria bacterium]
MAENEPFKKKWTRFCETILREGGFAKPRLKIFEIRRDLGFRPAGGCGRNAGAGVWDFWRRGL